jgi:hypothetical protein
MNNPVTEPISAAAAIKPRLIFDRGCRILGRLPCSAMVTEIGHPGEDAGGKGDAEAVPSKPPTTIGLDVLADSGSEERVSRGLVGS